MGSSEKKGRHIESRWTKTYKRFSKTVVEFFKHPETAPCDHLPQKYSYIFRRKSRWELTRISAIVSGIEFCYAAETAFVTPVLLSLGLNVKYVSMIWCLSPLIAFITTPILGSLSDSCSSRFGRRRPFIFTLSMGIILGLIFVPYGGRLGILLGDTIDTTIERVALGNHSVDIEGILSKPHNSNESKTEMLSKDGILTEFFNLTAPDEKSYSLQKLLAGVPHISGRSNVANTSSNFDSGGFDSKVGNRAFGIVITVIGTVFLDFCADVCQSPCRAYLLDITLPEEHATGLSIFSLNSGIGAAIGYGITAINWDAKLWGNVLESQVVVTFAVLSFLYLLFLSTSLYSFPEIPLPLLKDPFMFKEYQEKTLKGLVQNGTEMSILHTKQPEYSSIKSKSTPENKNMPDINGTGEVNHEKSMKIKALDDSRMEETLTVPQHTSLKDYLKSIISMPKSLRVLCLTNFLYGMGIMSFTIFFTDFVGECVFEGDPRAPKDSKSYELYKEGVRFGCWGMAFSSLSCAAYSSVIEGLAKKLGAKVVFSGGALVYSTGMVLMAVTRHKVSAILLSSTAGIMLTTLSTLPYILVANYHTSLKVQERGRKDDGCTRGLGTDVATVISVIVLSQCILSLSMGTVVEAVGSNVTIAYSAALFSACGAISATRVTYFDM